MAIGKQIIELATLIMESIHRQDKQHPYPEALLSELGSRNPPTKPHAVLLGSPPHTGQDGR